MASRREMRSRIRSVQSIAQVTRALEAVSTSKVRKAITALQATRSYSAKAWEVLGRLTSQPGASILHPLLADRPVVRRVLVVLISGDRGLAGAYHANVVRQARRKFDTYPAEVQYLVLGSKGAHLLQRAGKIVRHEFPFFSAPPKFKDTVLIGQVVVNSFLKGEVDEVWLVYTEFLTFLKQEPLVRLLLPLKWESEPDAAKASGKKVPVYSYEPDAEAVLATIVPRLIEVQIHQAILSSLASEHAMRMVTMRNATDNALSLLASLRLEYNKMRQQAITSELLDIATGAEALDGVHGE